MRFKKLILSAVIISTLLIGCTPDNPIIQSGPIEIKYEIISTSPVTNTFFQPHVSYTNSYGQTEIKYDEFLPGQTTWSKTIQLLTDNRPVLLSCGVNELEVASAGTITSNIYVNGILKSSHTAQTSALPGYVNVVTAGVSFWLN